jgi:vacuolar-type H+-ATPase subunit B/Vma2
MYASTGEVMNETMAAKLSSWSKLLAKSKTTKLARIVERMIQKFWIR